MRSFTYKTAFLKRLSATALAAIACLLTPTVTQGAMINWEVAITHGGGTAGSVINIEGTLLDAVNLGDTTSPTINGVTFTAGQSVGSLTYLGDTATNGPPVTADAGLNDLWSTIAFTSGNNTNTSTLSGLTLGNTYLVQAFGDHVGRTVTLGDGEAAQNTISLNNASAVGRFVADGGTQTLTFANSTGSQHLNGFQLRDLGALPPPPAFIFDPLRVDVDTTQGGSSIETQNGFESLFVDESTGDGSDTYATGFGNVTISVLGEGTRNRADNGGDPLSNLNEDFSFEAGAEDLMVTIAGLDAGEYIFTTHHFDDCCGGAGTNPFDVELTDALGTSLVIDDAVWSFTGETFTVMSDGINVITLRIDGTRMRFNGIQIQSTVLPVPEPTTAVLAMLGLGGLAMRRRRANQIG